MRASIDLLEEIDREDSLSFELREILHIEDSDGPDLAFLRVDPIGGESPPTPIALARDVATRRLRGRDRLPSTRQPDPRGRPDGPDLRRRVRQEATRAGPGSRAGERHHASRLLDARRQLGIGRAVPRHRGRGRPALRRQVPRGQLRGLEQRRRPTARRPPKWAGDATSTFGRERGLRSRRATSARRSVVGHPDLSRALVDHGRDRRPATRRAALATAPQVEWSASASGDSRR